MHSKDLNETCKMELRKIIKTISYENRQTISNPNLFRTADETPTGEHDIADAFKFF